MKRRTLKVLLGYRRLSDSGVAAFARNIADKLYAQEAFSDPPVTLAQLTEEIERFTTALAATAQGGTAATAEKNQRRFVLSGLLRQLAKYVEVECRGDLAALLSSGFDAASSNRTQEQLSTPSHRKD